MTKKLTTKGHQAYMSADNGPFRCDHCEYFSAPGCCNNSKIISYAKKNQFRLRMQLNGMAIVDAGGCSDEFKKK